MNRRRFFVTSTQPAWTAAMVGAQSQKGFKYQEIQWIDEEQDPSLILETGTLVAKVIDNTGLSRAEGVWRDLPYSHHLGYHGIRALWNKDERRNIVAPLFSWLNLQSLAVQGLELDPVDSRSRFGTGRGWPMKISRTGGGVALAVSRMPISGIEYSLSLKPAEPDGIDFEVRFNLDRKERKTAGFFASWPCYMSTFNEVQLFFPSGDPERPGWKGVGEPENFIVGELVQYRHSQRTFRFPERVSFPAVYGRIGDHVLAIMASRQEVEFFLVNAGGHRGYLPVQNPAWDFSLSLPDYPVNEPFGFQGRILYKPWKGSQEITERYWEWRQSLPR